MEELSNAIYKIQNVLKDIPRRAKYILQSLEELRDLLPPPEKTEGISEKLSNNIQDIIDFMNVTYTDDDLLYKTIDETTKLYPKLVELSARLFAWQEIFISYERFKLIEERFKRIDSVLPPYHFDFTEGIQSLDSHYLPEEIINNIKEAIKRFKDKEFPEAIYYCSNASIQLTDHFNTYLSQLRGENCKSSGRWWQDLEKIKNRLETTQSPQNLSPKSRLEWFVLSNLYIVQWLRNAHAHRADPPDNTIPQWQYEDRKTMVEDCDCARSAIIATLQVARYLQELLKNNNSP